VIAQLVCIDKEISQKGGPVKTNYLSHSISCFKGGKSAFSFGRDKNQTEDTLCDLFQKLFIPTKPKILEINHLCFPFD
jgi:hypothetical protein